MTPISDDSHDDDGALRLNAAELIATIQRTFDGVERNLTASEAARLYGAMAAQHEVNVALFEMILEANPHTVFSSQRLSAQGAMQSSLAAITNGLLDLASNSMSEEDRAKLKGSDDPS